MSARNLPGDGAERPIPFAIHLEAIVQNLNLIGPAVPLTDQMGSGSERGLESRSRTTSPFGCSLIGLQSGFEGLSNRR